MRKVTVVLPAGATPAELLAAAGLDPAEFSVARTVSQKEDRHGLFAYTLEVREGPALDLDQLYSGPRLRVLKPSPKGIGRARIFLFTDPQIGKVDSRRGVESGTAEFIALMGRIRAEIKADLRSRPVERALLADGGDGIESVQNTSSQLFTSDLSEPQAVAVLTRELHALAIVIYPHVSRLDVAWTPSNHARWRAGKAQLGRVGDDWGGTAHAAVRLATEAAGLPITYSGPRGLWDDITFADFWGHQVALHHGDRARPGSAGFEAWIAKMARGGETAGVELWLTGHYHNLRLGAVAVTPAGVTAWHLQGPALDPGSAYFMNAGGIGGKPGLASIDVTRESGVDLSSLHVFTGETAA